MAKNINRLGARTVATLTAPGLHHDGAGLYLNVTPSGSKSWRLIYRFKQKRCELGLGTLAGTTLAQAREKAAEAKALLRDGTDPKAARHGVAASVDHSFGAVALDLIDGLESGWRNAKHKKQWHSTLEFYAKPIWGKDVAAIDANDLIKILGPIWNTKHETASRVRGRMERVLDAARVRGLRSGVNPALYRGNLEVLLPKFKGGVTHHPAMPFADLPPFMINLRTRPAMAARALEFTILTAARTSETLQATWSEIDLGARLWTVAADRMKAGKEHRVPLTDAAVQILTALAKESGAEPVAYVFPSGQPDRPLSGMSMAMLLRRMNMMKITVHGFRSAFRDWVGETTSFPREVAEAALAHGIPEKVEQAYRRGDAFVKRRKMMTKWDQFLKGKI